MDNRFTILDDTEGEDSWQKSTNCRNASLLTINGYIVLQCYEHRRQGTCCLKRNSNTICYLLTYC